MKYTQSEIKNAISEMRTSLEGIKRRLDEAEDSISYLEDKIAVNTQQGSKKKKELKTMKIV